MKIINESTHGFDSTEERDQAIVALRAGGFNSFVLYCDRQAEFALVFKIDCKLTAGTAEIVSYDDDEDDADDEDE